MTEEWVVLEPNEKQGAFHWSSRGYKVRKSTLNEICSDFIQDIGCIDPITYNHIKWAMQRAIFDQEVLASIDSDNLSSKQSKNINEVKQ